MKKTLAGAAVAALVILAPVGIASADRPGPGDKQCSPGQNNIGGGPGNSCNGDKHGAPLKIKSCPGGASSGADAKELRIFSQHGDGLQGYEGQPGNQGGKNHGGKAPGLRGYEGQPGNQGGN